MSRECDSPPSVPRCGQCLYERDRVCRRYPPVPPIGQPMVGPMDWCGEWKAPKPKREATHP